MLLPPRYNPNHEPYIFWENFFSADELNAIAALPAWLDTQEAITGGANCQFKDSKIRKTQVAWLAQTQETQWIYDRIANVIANVNSLYFGFELTGLYESIQLGIYSAHEEGHYVWHVDGGKHLGSAPRKLSFAMLLSDPSEFEGGELQIKVYDDQAINLEQARGRAWIFPSYILHTVTPVTKGVRRSLVVWAGGPEFK